MSLRRDTSPGEGDDRLAQVQRELAAARQVSEVLFRYVDPDDVIRHALLTALEVVDAESGSILMADPERKELVFRHSTGAHPVAPGTAFPWDKGIAGTVFHSSQPVVITDVKKDKRFSKQVDEACLDEEILEAVL